MRILIVYRYFWPDTPPYATMLRDISRWLSEAGHEVEILTAQPSYKPEVGIAARPWRETVDGVRVRRLRLLPERGRGRIRMLNAGLFILQAFVVTLFGRRRDIVWTATMPPVVQAFAVMAAARLRGAKFLYHMQDIYPEVGLAGGALPAGRLARFLQWLDIRTLNRTAINVVLSDDMKAVIEARGAKPGKIATINNYAWGRTKEPAEVPAGNSRPVRFVFAGNIGRFQNLAALIAAFAHVDRDAAELHLVGEGAAKSDLVAQVQRDEIGNVFFHDHMPDNEAFAFMRNCDVGVVSLSPGIYRYAYPSKVWTYMAADLSMLAMVEEESALARMIRENDIGTVAAWSRDATSMGQAIEDVARRIRGGNGAHPAELEVYRPERARAQWLNLFGKSCPREDRL